ncbi:hypothetical protein PAMA_021249 [Pampus argenteus]
MNEVARNCQHAVILFYAHKLISAIVPLTLADLDEVPVEVIVDSSRCSVTCGLGIKSQTLCLLKDGKKAMEEDVRRKDGTEVSEECRVRKVKCRETWQCGLTTMTVTSGQRVEVNCLGEVMAAMGRFAWRVSWRYARGIISSDDSLFARWEAHELDRVILDPVREEDAGTYRCEVQDATFRRVKRMYWGIRVLPDRILDLDYESSLAQWETDGNQQGQTVPDQDDHRTALLYIVLCALRTALSVTITGLRATTQRCLLLLLVSWTLL